MPIIPFEALPAESRIWVFASERALDTDAARRLLDETDIFLERWQAHGEPLRAARKFTDDRFLVIGVDPTTANASGCSIDGLFRTLKTLEAEIGTRLLGGGRVFYRDQEGVTHAVSRAGFVKLAENGEVSAETPVFDTSLTTADEYLRGFERPAGETWVADMLARA
jgi:hypothetical protein